MTRLIAIVLFLACLLSSTAALADDISPGQRATIERVRRAVEPVEPDPGPRLDLALVGGMGISDVGCAPDAWLCIPAYAEALAIFGVNFAPAWGIEARAGVGAMAEAGALAGFGVRFRPIQLGRDWGEYEGNSMHALVLGAAVDSLMVDDTVVRVTSSAGYEYRSSFGLVGRCGAQLGSASTNDETGVSIGFSLAVGAEF